MYWERARVVELQVVRVNQAVVEQRTFVKTSPYLRQYSPTRSTQREFGRSSTCDVHPVASKDIESVHRQELARKIQKAHVEINLELSSRMH